jgi:hypothetical protein
VAAGAFLRALNLLDPPERLLAPGVVCSGDRLLPARKGLRSTEGVDAPPLRYPVRGGRAGLGPWPNQSSQGLGVEPKIRAAMMSTVDQHRKCVVRHRRTPP